MRLFFMVVVAALGISGAGAAPYLPVVGPTALRFRAVSLMPAQFASSSSEVVLETKLPAVEEPDRALVEAAAMTNSNSASNDLSRVDAPPIINQVTTVRSPPNLGTLSWQQHATNGPPQSWESPSDSSSLTPQMMLHFFQNWGGDGNAGHKGVMAPLIFIPPVPKPSPSSTSQYLSP